VTARILAVSVLATTALLAAGCGSSKNAATTTTISTVDWMNGLCSAASTYRTSVTDAAKSFSSNPSKASLQDAADQVQSATDTFVSTTKSLGKPNTSAGQQAKATVDTLTSGLTEDASTIEDAAGKGVIAGLPVITQTLTTAKSQVTTAFNELKGLDATGELGDAFSQATSCAALTSSS
jgi:hypothetical protein